MDIPEGTPYATLPLQVFLHPELRDSEKRLFWQISLLDCSERHCFASNEYLGKRIDIDKEYIRKGLARLEEFGFIKKWYEDPKDLRTRVIKIDHGFLQKYEYIIHDFYAVTEGQSTRENIPAPPGKTFPGTRENIPGEYIKDDLYKKENFSLLRKEKGNGVSSPRPSSSFSEQDSFDSYSEEVRTLFDHWNITLGSPLKQNRKQSGKTFIRALEGIQKALSRSGNDVELIAKAMENYHDLISQNGDTILNLKVSYHNVNLADFFNFDGFIKGRIKKQDPVYGVKSWFEECLKGQTYLFEKYGRAIDDDDYPEVTDEIYNNWVDSPFYKGQTTIRDERNFRKASERLIEWLERNKDNYSFDYELISQPEWAVKRILFPALLDSVKESDYTIVTTGWLASDIMFGKTLHFYFKKRGMVIGNGLS